MHRVSVSFSLSCSLTQSTKALNKYVLCVPYILGSILTLKKQQKIRLGPWSNGAYSSEGDRIQIIRQINEKHTTFNMLFMPKTKKTRLVRLLFIGWLHYLAYFLHTTYQCCIYLFIYLTLPFPISYTCYVKARNLNTATFSVFNIIQIRCIP